MVQPTARIHDPERTNQPDNTGIKDIVIPADEIRLGIEKGSFASQEELLSKIGGLGVEGYSVDAEDEPPELVSYYPEKEGSLGFMDKDQFIAFFDLTPVTTGLGASAWTKLEQSSIEIARNTKRWESRQYLEGQQARLGGILAQMPNPLSQSAQKIEAQLLQVNDRLNGNASGIPPSAPGLIKGKPFMLIETEGSGHPRPGLIPLETRLGSRMAKAYLSLDALYATLIATEGRAPGKGDMGKKTRPVLVRLLNSKIAAAHESGETGPTDPTAT